MAGRLRIIGRAGSAGQAASLDLVLQHNLGRYALPTCLNSSVAATREQAPYFMASSIESPALSLTGHHLKVTYIRVISIFIVNETLYVHEYCPPGRALDAVVHEAPALISPKLLSELRKHSQNQRMALAARVTFAPAVANSGGREETVMVHQENSAVEIVAHCSHSCLARRSQAIGCVIGCCKKLPDTRSKLGDGSAYLNVYPQLFS